MKRLAWISALVIVLATFGCAHKRATTGGPTTTVTAPDTTHTAVTTPPATETTTSTEQANFVWQDVHFAYDDASLGDEARSTLSSTGSYLSKHPQKVEIQGHCDERGSVEYNLALGERRAQSVKDYLVSYGINGNQLTTVSFGKERPLDPGHDESAWAKNRRAHFVASGSNP